MLAFNFSPFPVLETERLLLRRMNENDLPAFFKMRSDDRVMKYIGRPKPNSVEDLRPLFDQLSAAIDENRDISWAIEMKGKPGMIGQIGFYRTDHDNHRGEIGYSLQYDYFGKGIAGEAVTAVLDYGFNTMNFHSVKGDIAPENAASARVLERAGFIKEAHFRQNYYFNDRFLDTAVYCTLKTDWNNRRKS